MVRRDRDVVLPKIPPLEQEGSQNLELLSRSEGFMLHRQALQHLGPTTEI